MSRTESCRLVTAWVVFLLTPLAANGLPWDKDMVDQPSVKAQEAEVKAPEHSVSVNGKDPAPRPENVADVVRYRMEAAVKVKNPVTPGEQSVSRGEWVYQTHCVACHGASGKGDGLVGKKYVPPPMDLTTPYVQQQPDGQLFYTITRGGVVMPFYGDAIDIEDRWHLINYIKSELKAP